MGPRGRIVLRLLNKHGGRTQFIIAKLRIQKEARIDAGINWDYGAKMYLEGKGGTHKSKDGTSLTIVEFTN